MTAGLLNREFLRLGWYDLTEITDQWGFIRQSYMEYLPEILEQGQRDKTKGVRTHILDWDIFMNDFEKIAWESIRQRRMVLYPQFPLFNYFIDFANPVLRIGLEIDGKQHKPAKDLERDEWLVKFGWRIFRVPAREAHTECRDIVAVSEAGLEGEEKEQELTKWMLSSLDGVVQAIEWIYFADLDKGDTAEEGEDNSDDLTYLLPLARRTLEAHRLVEFPLT